MMGGDLSVSESGIGALRFGVGGGPEVSVAVAAGSETLAVVWSGAACIGSGVPTGVSRVGGDMAVSAARGSSGERMDEAHCSTSM